MSSQKAKLVSMFNEKLSSMVNEVVQMYPSMNDFKVLKGKLSTALTLTPKLTIEIFGTHVLKYEEQIMKKDEEFFLNLDFSGTAVEEFSHLRDVYTSSSAENKDCLWKYIILLTKVSKKYKTM